jgi:hypothetical protein
MTEIMRGKNKNRSPASLDPAVRKHIDDVAEEWAAPYLERARPAAPVS